MLSGRRLDLLDPSPLDVEIEDIAHGLARVARWNGQTSGAHIYSVAQHALLVEDIVGDLYPRMSADDRLTTLLHDGAEYVIGDMISPFKAVMGGAYKVVEARIQGAIHLRFGLPAETTDALHQRIKRADRVSAYYEATRLAGFAEREAREFFGKPPARIAAHGRHDWLQPLGADAAKLAFLERFETIEAARHTTTNRKRGTG
ncbi:MAG: HD family hydrolase [Pseudomonadota bacterium]